MKDPAEEIVTAWHQECKEHVGDVVTRVDNCWTIESYNQHGSFGTASTIFIADNYNETMTI